MAKAAMPADEPTGEIIKLEDQGQVTLFGTNSPEVFIEKAVAVATALKAIVDERKLFAVISDKQFPTVEAWTLIGSMVGVSPVVEWTKPLTETVEGNDIVIGYEARVEVRNLSGVVIGAAEAMCTHKERTWRNRDDYALRSMAQTRATSKALRGPLDFIMKLAGYQGTPAEEIPRPADIPKNVRTKPGAIPALVATDAIRDIVEYVPRDALAALLTEAGITKEELSQGDQWVEKLPKKKVDTLLDVLVAWEDKQELPWSD